MATSISVNQNEGEIVVTPAGEAPRTYAVRNGKVSVPDDEASEFLASVPGASLPTAGKSDTSSASASTV